MMTSRERLRGGRGEGSKGKREELSRTLKLTDRALKNARLAWVGLVVLEVRSCRVDGLRKEEERKGRPLRVLGGVEDGCGGAAARPG